MTTGRPTTNTIAAVPQTNRRRTNAAALFVVLQSLLLARTGKHQEAPGRCLAQAHLFQQQQQQHGAERRRITRQRRRGLANNLGIEPVTVEEKAPPIRRTRLPPEEDGAAHPLPDQDRVGIASSAGAGDGDGGSFVKTVTTTAGDDDEDCTEPAGPCERCTDSERVMIPESCMDTGKRQPFHCYDKSAEDRTKPSRTIYQSCARTPEDERFSMVRFQVFCLLAGAAALVSVKQQKAAAASLFDQRKLNLQKKRRTSDNPHDVEMTSIASMRAAQQQQQQQLQHESSMSVRQEESKSLLSDDNLDIV